MESAQEIIQRLLDERYEAGRDAGYDEGLKTGYEKAMFEMQDFVEAQLAPSSKLELADHPGDENDGASAPAQNGEAMSTTTGITSHAPYLRKAFTYLCENPGTTAHQARRTIGHKGAFYQLAKLGLAEKRGAQFFPRDEAGA